MKAERLPGDLSTKDDVSPNQEVTSVIALRQVSHPLPKTGH
jgi:hypothetical protein